MLTITRNDDGTWPGDCDLQVAWSLALSPDLIFPEEELAAMYFFASLLFVHWHVTTRVYPRQAKVGKWHSREGHLTKILLPFEPRLLTF